MKAWLHELHNGAYAEHVTTFKKMDGPQLLALEKEDFKDLVDSVPDGTMIYRSLEKRAKMDVCDGVYSRKRTADVMSDSPAAPTTPSPTSSPIPSPTPTTKKMRAEVSSASPAPSSASLAPSAKDTFTCSDLDLVSFAVRILALEARARAGCTSSVQAAACALHAAVWWREISHVFDPNEAPRWSFLQL